MIAAVLITIYVVGVLIIGFIGGARLIDDFDDVDALLGIVWPVLLAAAVVTLPVWLMIWLGRWCRASKSYKRSL